MNENRLYWVDKLKGLGMILVLIGHTSISSSLNKYIYTFHMPLFFFLSGYFFKNASDIKLITYIKYKFKKLCIPYFYWSIILFSIAFIEKKLGINPNMDLKKNIIGVFYGNAIDGWLSMYNGPLWFLLCLFVTEILFYIIQKFSSKLAYSLIFSTLIAYLDYKFISIRLPWSINLALTAVIFYELGYMFRLNEAKLNATLYKRRLYVFLLLSINFMLGFMLNIKTDMNMKIYGNYLAFIISAVSGILCYIYISKNTTIFNGFIFIGKNSLIFLALHMKMYYFIDLFFSKVLKYNIALVNRHIYDFIKVILAILAVSCIIKIKNKIQPRSNISQNGK